MDDRLAELTRQGDKKMVGIGQFGVAAGRGCAWRGLVEGVVEVAQQVIERQRPAVALVADKPGEDAE